MYPCLQEHPATHCRVQICRGCKKYTIKRSYGVGVGTRWLASGSTLGVLLIDSTVLLSSPRGSNLSRTVRCVGALLSRNALSLSIADISLSTGASSHTLLSTDLSNVFSYATKKYLPG